MKTYKKVIYITVMVMSILIIMTALSACGEKWERQKKDIESEYSGGLKRELIIYSATGEEVWRFVGKFDIEYSNGRILFDDENDIRHIIYFQNGTVIVNEIQEK